MENLKIRVTNKQESREAQELLLKYGATGNICLDQSIRYVCTFNGILTQYDFLPSVEFKQITLPGLRAMVNPMKEYLNENCNYEFVLSNKKYDGFIEIPEGAIRARFYPNDPDALEFEGDFCQWWHDKDNEWINYENYSNTLEHSRVVWQREQDEPFLTPECTLNDQYAEIEQVRQDINKSWGSVGAASSGAAQASGGVDATLSQRQTQYGCYEDVAHVTQQILSALRIGNYDELPAPMKESLHMIASKMARIVNGDPEYLDNWHDIGGYAKLIEKLIKGE